MCVQVIASNAEANAPVWDRDRVRIQVSQTLTHGQALAQVRLLLILLGALQGGDHPTCWCGDPVTVPGLTAWIPRQRGPLREEASGAA